MRVSVKWEDKQMFSAESQSGERIKIDTGPDHGGQGLGFRPSELLLLGMIGCTAIDVASMLAKMRIKWQSFLVEVEAERAPQPPQVFTKATLFYRLQGENLPDEKVERAVYLSLSKYCGMVNTLKKAMPISYCLDINGNQSEVRPAP